MPKVSSCFARSMAACSARWAAPIPPQRLLAVYRAIYASTVCAMCCCCLDCFPLFLLLSWRTRCTYTINNYLHSPKFLCHNQLYHTNRKPGSAIVKERKYCAGSLKMGLSSTGLNHSSASTSKAEQNSLWTEQWFVRVNNQAPH